MWLPIRETSDMTEATHFSQCVHDQQRRLEAEDCDSIRCAQLISGGRRRIRPPCTVPRSRSPHNVLHSPNTVMMLITIIGRAWASPTLVTSTRHFLNYICDRHCTSKIAINISIFHLGSYTRRARNCPDATRCSQPHPATAHRGRAVNFNTCSLCSSGIVLQV